MCNENTIKLIDCFYYRLVLGNYLGGIKPMCLTRDRERLNVLMHHVNEERKKTAICDEAHQWATEHERAKGFRVANQELPESTPENDWASQYQYSTQV